MKLIFLDFDGVINNSNCWSEGAPWRAEPNDEGLVRIPTDPACIERLNTLIERAGPGTRVVLSTSWRMFAHWSQLAPALAHYGFRGEGGGTDPRPRQ